MAGSDPRRSSRARSNNQSHNSSSASSVSGRPERSTRNSFNKGVSPQKSASTGSLSEPPEDSITAEDPFGTRRRTRGQAEDREKASSKHDTKDTAHDDEVQEEDEAVRCVCGNEEYQGPPPPEDEAKHGSKHDPDSFFSADVTDDTAGLFVQCDICKVWQHGGCVGIMTEESSPDEYFCEQCRQDLHRLWTASNGNVYSHYLPLRKHARTSSRAARESARSPTKETQTRNNSNNNSNGGRASSQSQTSKRRSTLNSREAGYDEAEALRRAIEASKEEAEQANRRPKRGRSDSQEKPDNKRQRTDSRSVSPPPDTKAEESDDGGAITRNGKSKSRGGAAARNQRNEKPSEKEEKERQAEANNIKNNKKNNKSDRRRAEDSDPSEEMPLAASRATTAKTASQTSNTSNPANTNSIATEPTQPQEASEPPPTSQPTPDSPPAVSVPASKSDSKKKSHKKKGRNQYTRDRDDESPGGSQSREAKDEAGSTGGGKHEGSAGSTGGGKGSKHKGGMSSKITMNDMRRRVGALLDFISRTQLELAGEGGPMTGIVSHAPNGGSAAGGGGDKEGEEGERQERDFKELGCLEMMDSLTRRLVKWQQQYAN